MTAPDAPSPASFACGQCAFFEASSFYPRCGFCGAIPKEQSFELMMQRARVRFVFQPCTLPEEMRPPADKALVARTEELFDVFGETGKPEAPETVRYPSAPPTQAPSVQSAQPAFSMEDF